MFNTRTRMYEGRSRKFKHDIRATQEVEQFLLKALGTVERRTNSIIKKSINNNTEQSKYSLK